MWITKRALPQLTLMTTLTAGLVTPPLLAAEPSSVGLQSSAMSAGEPSAPPEDRGGRGESLPDSAPSDTDWQFLGGLGTWAVGMGLVVVFHYSFFRLNDAVRDDAMKSYRAGVPDGESSCDRARNGVPSAAVGAASASEVASLCDEADTMELLRNITLPIGLGVSILGLALVGTSDTVSGESSPSESAGHWRFRMGGGPSGVAATAAVNFF